MRTKRMHVVFLLILTILLGSSGCSRLFGPSDADAVKAINESGALKGLTLQSPIVVLEKGGQKNDGSWPVKIRIRFTYEIQNGKMSSPKENTPVYNLIETKNAQGQTVWKVKFGS